MSKYNQGGFILIGMGALVLIGLCFANPSWPPLVPLASLLMVFVTGIMIVYTQRMAEATKRMADEAYHSRTQAQRQSEQQAFQKVLIALSHDIRQTDLPYPACETGGMEHFLDQWQAIRLEGLEEIQRFCAQIVLPSALLGRILGVAQEIPLRHQQILRDGAPLLSPDPEAYPEPYDLHRIYDSLKTQVLVLRLYLRQLACYVVCEAKARQFAEMAQAIEEVGWFEPTADMVVLGSLSCAQGFQFRPLTREPDNPIYDACRYKRLVEKARDKSEKQRQQLQ